jgi:hypothetical protein
VYCKAGFFTMLLHTRILEFCSAQRTTSFVIMALHNQIFYDRLARKGSSQGSQPRCQKIKQKSLLLETADQRAGDETRTYNGTSTPRPLALPPPGEAAEGGAAAPQHE